MLALCQSMWFGFCACRQRSHCYHWISLLPACVVVMCLFFFYLSGPHTLCYSQPRPTWHLINLFLWGYFVLDAKKCPIVFIGLNANISFGCWNNLQSFLKEQLTFIVAWHWETVGCQCWTSFINLLTHRFNISLSTPHFFTSQYLSIHLHNVYTQTVITFSFGCARSADKGHRAETFIICFLILQMCYCILLPMVRGWQVAPCLHQVSILL